MATDIQQESRLKSAFKITLSYLLFVAMAVVMTVIGLVAIPVGFIAYVCTLPFRRRSRTGTP